jgi:hypothetical protein
MEIVSEGTVLCRVPIDIRRPDIAAAFPEVPGAERSGFHNTLDVSEIGPAFDLIVQAVFEDGSRLQIGVIRGQHSSIRGEVEVVEVSTVPTDLSALLWGCNIELPVRESQTEVYAIDVEGWAVGRDSPAVAVELVNEEAIVRRVPIDIYHPALADRYPNVPNAGNSGFRATVNVLGLTPKFELSVRVVLQDENRIPIGLIKARRHSLRSDFQPKLQPIIVTTLGRTGSTWLMRLLGQHRRILTYRPFEYEPRVGAYWMQVLKTLSEPASYLQTLNTNLSNEHWWLGSESHPSELAIPADPKVHQWLGRNSIEALMAFCQIRIEEFYEQVAAIQGRTEAVYFAEKYSSEGFFTSIRTMIQEIYPHSREVLLVRDFRDMVCSILAYNTKQKFVAFGRENVSSDEEFVERVRLHALALLRNYESRSSRVYLLRYEDLVLRQAETLGSVLEYLDLDPAPSTVECMIRRASEETSRMKEHRTSPDPQQSIGRWRRDLDPSLQTVCQEAFGDILREFDYEE